MRLIRKILKNIFQTFYVLAKINWIKAFALYDSKAPTVIVLGFIKGRFGIELFCWDFGYIHYCINTDTRFSLSSDLLRHTEKKIFWSPCKRFLKDPELDYAKQLVNLAKASEAKGNALFPSSFEVSFLENKRFMHEYFQAHEIRTPKTRIFSFDERIDPSQLAFPVLVKGEHSSGSQAVYKLNSGEELLKLVQSPTFVSENENIIVQELLNIRRDLRVTFIGNDIVHHYWRINTASEWKPTSTSHGSQVDFLSFPSQWSEFIKDTIRKCNLTMGAFDIAWQNDDLNTEPYILEVTPRFSPNPPVDLGFDESYGLWKKKIFGRKVYYRLQTDLIFEMAGKYCRIVG